MKGREQAVRRMFARIAPFYDRMNSVITLGLHKRWRRAALDALQPQKGRCCLDLCAGTGDFSGALTRAGCTVTALDLSPEMLHIARRRTAFAVAAVVGDALELPFSNASFDYVTVGFGLRHCETDLPRLFAETIRVLRPGGILLTLELSHPPGLLWRLLTRLYIHGCLPLLGRIADADAYAYLARSLRNFPDAEELRNIMRQAGFTHVHYYPLMGGVVAVHLARADADGDCDSVKETARGLDANANS